MRRAHRERAMAPTNFLRAKSKTAAQRAQRVATAVRHVVITCGRIAIRARLANTPTADRIWAALPLHSTAETWGSAVHFEIPIESGRERGACQMIDKGQIAYWSEDDRIIIGFGPTPISRPSEIRLPSPCNVWAVALDDVGALKVVHPGEKVSIAAIANP
jgi:hypothetical protein